MDRARFHATIIFYVVLIRCHEFYIFLIYVCTRTIRWVLLIKRKMIEWKRIPSMVVLTVSCTLFCEYYYKFPRPLGPTGVWIIEIYAHFHRDQFPVMHTRSGGRRIEDSSLVARGNVVVCIVTDERPKTREKQVRGVGVHGDGAKGMNEHALWADLEEVVEVKEAALVGATSIKPELRRCTDLRFSSFVPAHLRAHVVCTYIVSKVRQNCPNHRQSRAESSAA